MTESNRARKAREQRKIHPMYMGRSTQDMSNRQMLILFGK
jgi:hypothetical protein